ITVDAIGPIKAIKALEIPNSDIARAIEEKNVKFLTTLRGIGKRSAEKIIAALNGKAGKFISSDTDTYKESADKQPDNLLKSIEDQVGSVLVEQLGYSERDSKILIAEALTKNKEISTAEQLFDDVFKRGSKP
ncbi:MAG: Holliday junction DNA helicase RuvA, partial [Desulfobacteraceae bacterium]|nr:Holliday junction DNA helicase RuvA [Desulfobacteraceae bacterium]